MNKTCWGCGHWLIGLGCCLKGLNEYVQTEHDHTCNNWIVEGTSGTVTDYEGLTDGDTFKDNEYLKDDESNL